TRQLPSWSRRRCRRRCLTISPPRSATSTTASPKPTSVNMLYDIRLHLSYDDGAAGGGSRHQVRVLPQTIAGVQRVVAASLSFVPTPSERTDFADFFGNNVTTIAFRDVHDGLDIRMSARVSVSRPEPGLDVSPDLQ